MQLKTILNRVQKHSSFVYEEARFVEGAVPALEIDLRPRANSRATCSGCGRRGPTYDRGVCGWGRASSPGLWVGHGRDTFSRP